MVPNEIAREKPASQGADNDIHKGAMEEDRPGPERSNLTGLDHNGLPNDPVAIAEDAIGARADQSQG
jgi:hypothetical protein